MKLAFYLTLIIFIFSCFINHSKSSSIAPLNSEVTDSLFSFSINGKYQEFRVNNTKINLQHDLEKLQKWINEYENNPKHELRKKLEITGEGVGNTIYSSIKMQKDGFLVEHIVYQSDTIIWQDSLLIDDGVSYNWEDDSLFFKLKPYSTFYFACKYADRFINDKIDVLSESFLENYTNIPNENDTSYWAKYLRCFKGRTIAKLALEDGGDWIWDARKRKFIIFFEP